MEDRILPSLFPTYTFMNSREKVNFKQFLYSKTNTDNIMKLVKYLGIQLIIVEQDKLVLSTYNDISETKNKTTKLKLYDKELKKFDKKMQASIRKKNQESRFRSFMKTGLRADIRKKKIQISDSFDIITNNKFNIKKAWNKLSLWHKKKAIQKYIESLDENDNNIKILLSLTDEGILNMDEPEFNIKKSEIISLTKKIVKKTNSTYKSKMNALQLIKKQRQKRKDLENKSVTFEGDFVAENI